MTWSKHYYPPAVFVFINWNYIYRSTGVQIIYDAWITWNMCIGQTFPPYWILTQQCVPYCKFKHLVLCPVICITNSKICCIEYASTWNDLAIGTMVKHFTREMTQGKYEPFTWKMMVTFQFHHFMFKCLCVNFMYKNKWFDYKHNRF